MPYCSKCGVEIEDRLEKDPLCNTPVQNLDAEELSDDNRYPSIKEKSSMANPQKRFLAWEMLSILLVTSFLIVLTINLTIDGTLSWAGYPMAAIGVAWIYTTLILLFFKKPALIFAGNFTATIGFLAIVDMFNGKLEWFLVLGLPIVGIIVGASLFNIILTGKIKDRGANIAACIILTTGICCIGFDLLISAYMGAVSITWSAIVMVSLIPITMFLLYYHYSLRKKIDIKRIFHV